MKDHPEGLWETLTSQDVFSSLLSIQLHRPVPLFPVPWTGHGPLNNAVSLSKYFHVFRLEH